MKKRSKIFYKIAFIFVGLGSLMWFLVRAIPKPSRATYPCMRASYPIMTSFIIYLIGSTISPIVLFRLIKTKFASSKYVISFSFLSVSIFFGSIVFQNNESDMIADTFYLDTANAPIGVAKGVMPGRVTWAYDQDATNTSCSFNKGDEFFLPKNTNIDVVVNMINKSVLALADKSTLKEAWESIFTSFNIEKGKGNVGYSDGEKIFIKCNFTNTNKCDEDYNLGKWANNVAKTSPQVILVILRHLVNELEIPQENIAFGDPMQCIIQHYYDLLYAEFPNIKYIDQFGNKGRTLAVRGEQADIFYSDRGTLLTKGVIPYSGVGEGLPIYQDTLYQVIEEADYMINLAAMKAHESAGITLCAKNHFGSQTRQTAIHLHMGNVLNTGDIDRTGYGKYRIQVDLMGHKMLGRNTILNVVDGLWAGPSSGGQPVKFGMPPFNNDYTSSVFMSMDPVAVESVLYDFLKREFSAGNPHTTTPQTPGVDDFLHQAADSSNWPDSIQYDPENDGELLQSLGVHEHWNNSTDMQYSKNLGSDQGIELFKVDLQSTTSVDENLVTKDYFELLQNYPNPFNPSTTINFTLPESRNVQLIIYDFLGKKVKLLVNENMNAGSHHLLWDGTNTSGVQVGSGIYYYKVRAGNYSKTMKMLLLK